MADVDAGPCRPIMLIRDGHQIVSTDPYRIDVLVETQFSTAVLG
jgi:hypothetical protein